MNSQTYLPKRVSLVLVAGLVKTLAAILGYRLLVSRLEQDWRYRLYTLILIIAPLFLYITLKKLVATHWNYQLRFLRVMLTGVCFITLAGVGIAILDYIILSLNIPWFADNDPEFSKPFFPFLVAYVSWYTSIGLVTTPLIYVVLRWQLKDGKRN